MSSGFPSLVRALVCGAAVVIAACATGGAPAQGPGLGQDAATTPPPGHADARGQTPDAGLPHDAQVVPDAAVAPPDAAAMPDAGAGSGGQICQDNTMCPDPGTCCFVAVCVPGQGLGSDLCFPN